MANQYVNKVIIGKEVKLDLTADSVTPDKLAKGITAHDKTGAPITGTSTKDVDSTDATAAVAEVLDGKTVLRTRCQDDRHDAQQRGRSRENHPKGRQVHHPHGLPRWQRQRRHR